MVLTYFVIFVLIKYVGVFKNSFVRVHAIHIELEFRKCWFFEDERERGLLSKLRSDWLSYY